MANISEMDPIWSQRCCEHRASTAQPLLAYWCMVVAFLVPLRLTLAYAALIPLIVFSLVRHPSTFSLGLLPRSVQRSAAAFLFFLCSIIISAMVGIDPERSIRPFISLLFFSLTILIFARFATLSTTLLALFTGQTVAALHSMLAAALPGIVPSVFNGTVTESGQIAITLVMAMGVAWSTFQSPYNVHSTSRYSTPILSGTLTLALTAICFFHDTSATGILGFGIMVIFARLLLVDLRGRDRADWQPLVYMFIPFIVTALLVNLKRGPWVGVFVGTTLFALIYVRQILGVLTALAITIAVSVPPIRERLLASYEHFTISGGRSTIWQIGGELIARYPLGIGYHNSPVLQKFAPEIPPELKHFHNNLLNIAAENGWLSAALFIWFFAELLRLCFAKPRDLTRVTIGCALISWQVAGIVEYNFGDSEVTLVAWILIGLLVSACRNANSGDGTDYHETI